MRSELLGLSLLTFIACRGAGSEPATVEEPTTPTVANVSTGDLAPVPHSESMLESRPLPEGIDDQGIRSEQVNGGGDSALLASAVLARLPVTANSTARAGYKREYFGRPWVDVDENGCDTRTDILARDLEAVQERGCLVLAGRLADPYTGRVLRLVKANMSEVHIDHVVPLANAWATGAASWSDEQRLRFANDPLNLLAVAGTANTSKRDSDAATWLPPNEVFRCRYVARQAAVKAKYELAVSPDERSAFERVLAKCPSEPVPTSDPIPTRGTNARLPDTQQDDASVGAPAKRYRTCKEVKAAGEGPYQQGRDPEYEFYRDRDKDGLVCE